jgi:hypothetical protein
MRTPPNGRPHERTRGRRAWHGLALLLVGFVLLYSLPEFFPDHYQGAEAIWNGDAERLSTLLDRRLDPDTRRQWSSQVQRLLEPRSSTHSDQAWIIFDPPDRSLLHLAIERGRSDMAELLVRHGADVNARNMRRETPLFGAASSGDEALVRLLLENGADPSATDIDGGTALRDGPPDRGRPRAIDSSIVLLIEDATAGGRAGRRPAGS